MILVFRIIHNVNVLFFSMRGGWCSEGRKSVTFLENIRSNIQVVVVSMYDVRGEGMKHCLCDPPTWRGSFLGWLR